MRLKPVAAAASVLLAASTLIVTKATPANACSCAPPAPASEAAATSEWVFLGRQVDRYEARGSDTNSWEPVRLVVEVITVYKGDVPDMVELATGSGESDCGVDLSHRDVVGLALTPNEDGTVPVGSCGGVYTADDIRWLYEPFPTGTGSGEPGFLVGVDSGRARIALLDEHARLLDYAEGDGRLASAAVCPGGAKIAEMVQPDQAWSIGGDQQPYLEIRDVDTLTIDNHYDLDISERDLDPLNGMGWVLDLECHDVDAAMITYLLPTGVWDQYGGSNLPGEAELHIWRSGELTAVPAGEARTVAVDPDREVFYAITGPDGTTLDIRDLDGHLLETMPVPSGHQAWKLALSPDLSQLAILSRDVPMERQNWFFAEVNSLLVMDTETREVETFSLPAGGFAQLLRARDDGFTASTYLFEEGTTTLSSIANGSVDSLGSYPTGDLFVTVAIGARTALLTEPGEKIDRGVVAVDLTDGELVPVADLVRSRLAVPFPGTVPVAEPLPAGTTTTNPPATAVTSSHPPTSDIATTDASLTQAQDVATPVSDIDNGGSATLLAALLAAVFLALSAAVLVLARRRHS